MKFSNLYCSNCGKKNEEKIKYILLNKKNYLFHPLLALERNRQLNSFIISENELKRRWRDNNEEIDIYIHIPFCERKCRFCNTRNTIGSAEQLELYLGAITSDLRNFSQEFKKIEFRNLWIGGGTPNIFNISQLERLFNQIFSLYKFKKENSFRTIELHPALLTKQQLDLIKSLGFTDVSIGVQSLDRDVLKSMLREDSKIIETKKLIKYALHKKFNEVNCDLVIFTLDDNLHKFSNSLIQLIKLNPDMITVFPLQLPGGAALPVCSRRFVGGDRAHQRRLSTSRCSHWDDQADIPQPPSIPERWERRQL